MSDDTRREIALQMHGHHLYSGVEGELAIITLRHHPKSLWVQLAVQRSDEPGLWFSAKVDLQSMLDLRDLCVAMVGELCAAEGHFGDTLQELHYTRESWLPEELRDRAHREQGQDRELSDLLLLAARRIRFLEGSDDVQR